MKHKCEYCNVIFEYKIKDLKPIENESNKYLIFCHLCYTSKTIYYGNKPKHIKYDDSEKILNDLLEPKYKIDDMNILQNLFSKLDLKQSSKVLKEFNERYSKLQISKERLSRNELLDSIVNKNVVKQLVSGLDNNSSSFKFVIICFLLIFMISIIIFFI